MDACNRLLGNIYTQGMGQIPDARNLHLGYTQPLQSRKWMLRYDSAIRALSVVSLLMRWQVKGERAEVCVAVCLHWKIALHHKPANGETN